MKYQIKCKSCGWLNRVPFHYSNRRYPLCGNKGCRATLTEPSHIKILRHLILYLNYVNESLSIKLGLSLIMLAVGYYIILGKHRNNGFVDTIGNICLASGIVLLLICFSQFNQKLAEWRVKREYERARRNFEDSISSNLPLIQQYMDDLLKSIGGAIPTIKPDVLLALHSKKDFPKMLGWIKNAMRLECKVGLKLVDTIEGGNPMQIQYTVPMPAIGTNEFKNTRVVVHATKDILETKPFGWVVAGFAHELSHVFLPRSNPTYMRKKRRSI
jgi:hypothetical protein